MKLAKATVGQEITGFWYKKKYYPVAGTIKEIVTTNKQETAVILICGTSEVITWLEFAEVA
jgi:glyoxylate utilization-related uncharacterized protein